jgi:hypothetical protein
MKDKPLLHSRQLYDLVLKYFFGDGHRESFPNRNPHMNKLTHMMSKVTRSTIAFFLISNRSNNFNVVLNYFVLNVD